MDLMTDCPRPSRQVSNMKVVHKLLLLNEARPACSVLPSMALKWQVKSIGLCNLYQRQMFPNTKQYEWKLRSILKC